MRIVLFFILTLVFMPFCIPVKSEPIHSYEYKSYRIWYIKCQHYVKPKEIKGAVVIMGDSLYIQVRGHRGLGVATPIIGKEYVGNNPIFITNKGYLYVMKGSVVWTSPRESIRLYYYSDEK